MAVLALSASAAAQFNTGEISGIVRDTVGGVLPLVHHGHGDR